MPRRRLERMQNLARLRKREEEIRAQELALVRRRIQGTEQQRASIEDMQRMMLTTAHETAQGAFQAPDVQRYYQFERHLSRMADESDATLAQLKRQESERLGNLEQARIKRKVIERLAERVADTYQAETSRLERLVMDEVAINRSAFNRMRNK